jgi:hypothetical protein
LALVLTKRDEKKARSSEVVEEGGSSSSDQGDGKSIIERGIVKQDAVIL